LYTCIYIYIFSLPACHVIIDQHSNWNLQFRTELSWQNCCKVLLVNYFFILWR